MNTPEHQTQNLRHYEIHRLGRRRFIEHINGLDIDRLQRLRAVHENFKNGSAALTLLSTGVSLLTAVGVRLSDHPYLLNEANIIPGALIVAGLYGAGQGVYYFSAAMEGINLISRRLQLASLL